MKTVMDIKEIALRIGEEADEYADAKLQSKGECHPDWHTVRDEYFAEALIAEVAKQNEPVYAFRRKGLDDFCTCDKRRFDELLQKPALFEVQVFYRSPPTAEQIANETAEACARYVNRFINGDGILNEVWISDIESALRNGEWRKFVKEV